MTRVQKFGYWLLLLPLSTGMLWAEKFPTDSHPPTLEDARALLPALCESGVMAKTTQHGVDSGCRLCPSVVPGGGAFNSTDPAEASFSLYGVIYGSFTREGSQQAVADFSGCEPHANNFGGSVLFEKSPRGWRVKSYQGGFISSECLKYPMTNGRDLLICRGGYSGQGENDSSLFVFDYLLPKEQRSQTLLTTSDTLATCLGGDQTMGSIEGIELRDLSHDGLTDLAVSVKAAKVHIPDGHEQDCGANIKFPNVKPQEVDFLFSNGSFKVAPWSARTKQAIETLFGQ
jgi:hypothetical protein